MRTILTGLLLLALAQPLAAQRNELTFEASVFRGTVGYARRVGPQARVGMEAGFGFPQLDRTLTPRDEQADFQEYLHAAFFLRVQPVRYLDVDAGLRASVVDLWECTASDCWPSLFGGVYVQPMVGWRKFKVGMRVVAGIAGDHQEGSAEGRSNVVALDPLVVRATLPW